MAVLVIAEHNNQQVKLSTLATITAALAINQDVTVLIAGYDCQPVAEQLAKIAGVKRIWVVESIEYQHQLAESLATLISQLAKEYSHILAPASSFGKNILPRVAALLDVEQISDISCIIDANTFKRPIYAGNAIATVQSSAPIKVITVRPTCFSLADQGEQCAPIIRLDMEARPFPIEFIEFANNPGLRPELAGARVVVAGGRGLKNAENFKLLENLADRLAAAIGATRAAVDAGFAPNDYQVGQTGKVVAPDLYIAVGISGAIQHIAGMKDSKVIVAINKDAEAPIFKVANYGLVGDLFEILPELEQALENLSQ